MSRAKAQNRKLPELFSEQSWHDFLSQQHSVNQELLYRDPEKAGWTLLAVLKGEGEDAPELFRVYQCGTRKTALPSEFVTEKVAGASGATNTNLDQEGSPKGMQARRRQQWTSAIALIHFLGDCPKTTPDHPKLRALLISKALFQIISHDIIRLLDSSNAQGDQALLAKEAGAAYESGLKNFLTSLGALKKRGTPRASNKKIPLQWEWIALLRAKQFVIAHSTLPTQTWLTKQLQADGISYMDKDGRGPSKWRNLFDRVGLSLLPK